MLVFVAAVQVQLNMWLAAYYADPGASLEALSEQLAAWLVSCCLAATAHRCLWRKTLHEG